MTNVRAGAISRSNTPGETVKLAYVDQSRDSLDGSKTVYEEISGGRDVIEVGKRELSARAYVGGFNFKNTDQQKLVKELSGGERNRVHLAKVIKSGGNVLLLDEPSNDLDVETLRALEEGILDFAGCVLVISHDLDLLDEAITRVLHLDRPTETAVGTVVEYKGTYSQYIAARAAHLPPVLQIADSNFGMYAHDLEVCDVVAEVRRRLGWPGTIEVSTGKNRKERVLEAVRRTEGAMRFGPALQSTDPTTLANIKRSNISEIFSEWSVSAATCTSREIIFFRLMPSSFSNFLPTR